MRQVKVTVASKIVHRIAVIACVGLLGVGAAACGSSGDNVTPQAPTGSTPAGVTTTASPQSGGSGF
jgi:hypothetical protein